MGPLATYGTAEGRLNRFSRADRWNAASRVQSVSPKRKHRAIAGAVATILMTVLAMMATTLPAGAATSGWISGIAGKCIDVSGANPADGTRIQLWTCNGTNAQD